MVPDWVVFPVTWTDDPAEEPAEGEVTVTVAKDATAVSRIDPMILSVCFKVTALPKGCRELTREE